MRNLSRVAPILLLVLAVAAPIPAGAARAGSLPGGPGKPVDFTLPDLRGNPVSLGAFLGKKPVLIVFWATWCPHCNEAVPEINRLYAESGRGARLQVLALNYKESDKKVGAFLRRKKAAYPVLLDREGAVARSYRVLGIPTYILIDRQGRIVYRDHELPKAVTLPK